MKQETLDRIAKINHLVAVNHVRGNNKRKRYYQSLMNWVISKELDAYGSRI